MTTDPTPPLAGRTGSANSPGHPDATTWGPYKLHPDGCFRLDPDFCKQTPPEAQSVLNDHFWELASPNATGSATEGRP